MKAIHKDILRLAIPSILANITVPVVGMVDIAVTGHLSGAVAASIGGISIGSMLFDLLYWNFAFLRAGTGGLTAQAYGRADKQECGRILCRGLGLSLLMAALVLAIQWPFTRLAFLVVDSSPEVRDLALQYYFIRVWAAPATLSLMTLRGWFIGMQDTVSSMWTDLVVNGMNIIASIVLALGIGGWPGLGFRGVAYGTLVAQYSGLLFALGVLVVKYRAKVLSGIGMKEALESFRGNDLKGFFSMNADLFLRSVGFIMIYIGFTVISARFGDLMLASSAIMMKLLMLFSFFTDGFAYAGQALTGKFIGERNPGGLQETVKAVFNWSMAVAVLFIGI
ncbi:MAG: MATE family efflux transporter [Bacteroidales bacterium]|nr:MATE family efflux transporter [Bacteroidales bacterium]